ELDIHDFSVSEVNR
ncbi:DUF2525 domain-containing protein, partial [Escherichia coli]